MRRTEESRVTLRFLGSWVAPSAHKWGGIRERAQVTVEGYSGWWSWETGDCGPGGPSTQLWSQLRRLCGGLALFVPQPLPLQLLPSLNVFRLLPLSEPHRLQFTDCLAPALQRTHFPQQLAVDDLSISSADFNTLSNLLAFFFFF